MPLENQYMEALNKYKKLKISYNLLKNNDKYLLKEVDKLKNLLNEKEEKIAELLEMTKTGREFDADETYLKIRYVELIKKIYIIKIKSKDMKNFFTKIKSKVIIIF